MRNKTKTDMVRDFSEATGGSPPYEPMSPFDDMKVGLIEEEIEELQKALLAEVNDKELSKEQAEADILKEMCDLVYVVLGYAVHRGWDFDTAFNRVHKSNMSKIPEDGVIKYRDDGKVLKPDTYKPANLEDLV